jgi:hypothetical protein
MARTRIAQRSPARRRGRPARRSPRPAAAPDHTSEAYRLASARLTRVLERGFEVEQPARTPELVSTETS